MRSMIRGIVALMTVAALAGCDDYTPTEKRAAYSPEKGVTQLPAPCPDWSKNATVNYSNARHSNFGCAVENNLAVQLEDPRDLARGHGAAHPDSELSPHVIELYRAGTIPVPLTPMQKDSASE